MTIAVHVHAPAVHARIETAQSVVLVEVQPSVEVAVELPGIQGPPGPIIELAASATHVRWRWVGGSWFDLVALADLRGAAGIDGTDGTDGADGVDGREVELRAGATHVQWRRTGEDWADLVALDDLRGTAGASNWDDIAGRPASFPPTEHGHQIADIEGLPEALAQQAAREAIPAGGADGQVLTRSAAGAVWADLPLVFGIDGGNARTPRG